MTTKTIRASVLLSGLLAGCATVGDFVSQGQKANIAIEQTANNTVLLNAIRASQRRPMHFTSLSNVKAPIGDGVPSLSVALGAFGPDRATHRFFAPSLSYKPDVPSFDVTVWDSQAFMRGVTQPFDPKTFVYYLDQGWPAQLLIALLVREISIVDKDGKVRKQFVNYPENRKQYDEFQKAALTLSSCQFAYRKSKEVVEYGPPIPAEKLNDPAAIAKIKEQGLLLVAKKRQGAANVTLTDYQVVKEEESQVARLEDLPDSAKGSCAPFGLASESLLVTSSLHLPTAIQALVDMASPPSGTKDKYAIAFSLRSPEAALYHLGELARVQITGARIASDGSETREVFIPEIDLGIPPRKSIEKLFVVNAGPVPSGVRPAAVTEYEGVTYWISPDPAVAGRSMRAITLVEQFVNMQKDAKDLPVSTTIRVTQ